MNSLHIRHPERSEAISGLQNDKDCNDLLRKSRKDGFTLIELSVVLLIIALITSMAVKSGIAVLDTAKQTATIKKMAEIDKALLAYRTANNRLPSPASFTSTLTGDSMPTGLGCYQAYGIDMLTPNLVNTYYMPCIYAPSVFGTTQYQQYWNVNGLATDNTVVEGAVPTVTLGLPNDFMYDGWGNKFRYAVDSVYTSPTNLANGATYPSAFTGTQMDAKCGGITIQYDSTTGHNRTKTAIYALISHGKNGHGAFTQNGVMLNANSTNAAEKINCHCDSTATPQSYNATYVQQDATTSASSLTNTFDDIVTYKERPALRISSDKGGNVCPYIYVIDNDGVQQLDLQGNSLPYQANAPTSAGAMNHILDIVGGLVNGLAVDNIGNIWVAAGSSGLREYPATSNGAFTAEITLPINSNNSGKLYGDTLGFSGTTGIAIDKNNFIWIVDSFNNRVLKSDTNGNLVLSIPASAATAKPSSSSSLGYFNAPYSIAIDSKNNVFVFDSGNVRVEEFDQNGVYINNFIGTSGAGSAFHSSSYIAIDAADNIWVSDATGKTIQEYSNSGSFIRKLDTSSAPNVTCYGSFNNYYNAFINGGTSFSGGFVPKAIAISPTGDVWVEGKYNGQSNTALLDINPSNLTSGGASCINSATACNYTCTAFIQALITTSPQGLFISSR